MQFLRGRAGSHRTWSPPSPPSAGTSSTTPPCSFLIGSSLNFTTSSRIWPCHSESDQGRAGFSTGSSSLHYTSLFHLLDWIALSWIWFASTWSGSGWIGFAGRWSWLDSCWFGDNDQYIGINTWRRRICLRTPTSNSSTLCFSPAWLVGGCTMHIIVHLSNNAQSIRSTAPALVSMNLASKEVAKSFPSDHKKW